MPCASHRDLTHVNCAHILSSYSLHRRWSICAVHALHTGISRMSSLARPSPGLAQSSVRAPGEREREKARGFCPNRTPMPTDVQCAYLCNAFNFQLSLGPQRQAGHQHVHTGCSTTALHDPAQWLADTLCRCTRNYRGGRVRQGSCWQHELGPPPRGGKGRYPCDSCFVLWQCPAGLPNTSSGCCLQEVAGGRQRLCILRKVMRAAEVS